MKRNRLVLLYLILCFAKVERIDFIHLLKFSTLFLRYNYVYFLSWMTNNRKYVIRCALSLQFSKNRKNEKTEFLNLILDDIEVGNISKLVYIV
jgi:hypothetical protein